MCTPFKSGKCPAQPPTEAPELPQCFSEGTSPGRACLPGRLCAGCPGISTGTALGGLASRGLGISCQQKAGGLSPQRWNDRGHPQRLAVGRAHLRLALSVLQRGSGLTTICLRFAWHGPRKPTATVRALGAARQLISLLVLGEPGQLKKPLGMTHFFSLSESWSHFLEIADAEIPLQPGGNLLPAGAEGGNQVLI